MTASTPARWALIVAAGLILEAGLPAQTGPATTNSAPGTTSGPAGRPSPPGTQPKAKAESTKPKPLLKCVTSKDGTVIAFEQSGQGPAVILIASALADRSAAGRLAGLLAGPFTIINYDRRGRGASGDTPPYAVDREIEDVEALINEAGGSASLFGSSSGAVLALEAAARLPAKVTNLAVFEPPFVVDDSRPPIPPEFATRLGRLVAAGQRGEAVEYFMDTGVRLPREAVAAMRKMPMWAGLERLAHTLPYDVAIMGNTQAGRPLPANRWQSVTARTLVIDGEKSDAFLRSASRAAARLIPGAQYRTLAGLDHGAVTRAPGALAPVLREFFGGPSEAR